MPTPVREDAERVAKRFHEVYEALAPKFDWETQQRSRVAWDDVPHENRALMIAVANELIEAEAIFPGPSLLLYDQRDVR
jgi:hypothetical protein